MRHGQFDAEGFYSALDSERVARRLFWKDVARGAGVSPSTLTRMAQGRRPDVDTMAALASWSGLNTDDFVRRPRSSPSEAESLAQITAHLRADAQLTPKAANAIEAVLRTAYDQLSKEE